MRRGTLLLRGSGPLELEMSFMTIRLYYNSQFVVRINLNLFSYYIHIFEVPINRELLEMSVMWVHLIIYRGKRYKVSSFWIMYWLLTRQVLTKLCVHGHWCDLPISSPEKFWDYGVRVQNVVLEAVCWRGRDERVGPSTGILYVCGIFLDGYEETSVC